MENNNNKGKNGEAPKPVVARTPADIQRLKLEKLMKNPDKLVIIPEKPKERGAPVVPDFVRNVMGSSAGAGSGEFHVYRHLRRKEYARQHYMSEKARWEKLEDEYHEKIEENKRKAEEETAKKRAKRLKKKQNARKKGKGGAKAKSPTPSPSESEEEEEDEGAPNSLPEAEDNEMTEKTENAESSGLENIAKDTNIPSEPMGSRVDDDDDDDGSENKTKKNENCDEVVKASEQPADVNQKQNESCKKLEDENDLKMSTDKSESKGENGNKIITERTKTPEDREESSK